MRHWPGAHGSFYAGGWHLREREGLGGQSPPEKKIGLPRRKTAIKPRQMRLINRNCDVRFVCARLAATGRVLFDTPLTSQHYTPNRGACFVCQNKHLETPSPTPAVPHGFTISWVWCSQAPGTRRQKTPFVWQCSVRSRRLSTCAAVCAEPLLLLAPRASPSVSLATTTTCNTARLRPS